MNHEIKQRLTQIAQGEVPTGYQKTKVGIVPVEWEEKLLKDFFVRLNQKNTINSTNVLTISAQFGLISQTEYFKKEIASADKSKYYLLEKGDFAYNKSYSNGYPFGAIKSLSLYEQGVVSPLYICFTKNNDSCDREFLC